MKTLKSILLITLVGFFFSSTMAQGDLISAADFTKLMKTDKSLVIIDASKADTYKKSHIKNAVNIPHKTLYQETEVEGLIESPEKLAKIFGEKGVSNASAIVVYDGGSQKYSSRVYWILKYLGASNVKLLHKDMDMFRKSRVPLTAMPTKAKTVTFTPNVNSAIIADIAYVKSGKAKVIDVRAADEFDGSAEKSDGHIPGSININYKDLLNDKEAFKSKAEIEAIFAANGLNANTPMVGYCQTSVRATVMYAAIVNILGWDNFKVYDGAYNEWVGKGNKVENKTGLVVGKKTGTSSGGC